MDNLGLAGWTIGEGQGGAVDEMERFHFEQGRMCPR